MHFSLYFIRHFDMNEDSDDISAACRAAEEALGHSELICFCCERFVFAVSELLLP